MHNHADDISGKIFFKFYKAQKKLGEGSFGKIYTGPFIVMTGNENLPVNGLSGVYRLDKGELYK